MPDGNGVLVMRRAEAADVPAIGTIYRRGWAAAYGHFIPAETIARVTDIAPEEWARRLAEDRPGLFVAEQDGVVLGWVRVVGPEIVSLHVRPERHGQGIGRRLLAVGREAAGPGAFLLCMTENRRARAFYEAQGWAPRAAATVTVGAVTYPALRFEPGATPPAPGRSTS